MDSAERLAAMSWPEVGVPIFRLPSGLKQSARRPVIEVTVVVRFHVTHVIAGADSEGIRVGAVGVGDLLLHPNWVAAKAMKKAMRLRVGGTVSSLRLAVGIPPEVGASIVIHQKPFLCGPGPGREY